MRGVADHGRKLNDGLETAWAIGVCAIRFAHSRLQHLDHRCFRLWHNSFFGSFHHRSALHVIRKHDCSPNSEIFVIFSTKTLFQRRTLKRGFVGFVGFFQKTSRFLNEITRDRRKHVSTLSLEIFSDNVFTYECMFRPSRMNSKP